MYMRSILLCLLLSVSPAQAADVRIAAAEQKKLDAGRAAILQAELAQEKKAIAHKKELLSLAEAIRDESGAAGLAKEIQQHRANMSLLEKELGWKSAQAPLPKVQAAKPATTVQAEKAVEETEGVAWWNTYARRPDVRMF
jgi:hypothetical protein